MLYSHYTIRILHRILCTILFLYVPLVVPAQNWQVHLNNDSTISRVTLWKVDMEYLYALTQCR